MPYKETFPIFSENVTNKKYLVHLWSGCSFGFTHTLQCCFERTYLAFYSQSKVVQNGSHWRKVMLQLDNWASKKCLKINSGNTSCNIFWRENCLKPILGFIRHFLKGGEGSKKCKKSVTYYLNGPKWQIWSFSCDCRRGREWFDK